MEISGRRPAGIFFYFVEKKRDRNRVDSDEDSRSGTGRPLDGAAFRIGKWSRCCAPCPHSCTTLNLKLSMRPTFRPMRNWEESPKLVRWLLRSVDSRVTRFRRWPVKSTVSFFFFKDFPLFFLKENWQSHLDEFSPGGKVTTRGPRKIPGLLPLFVPFSLVMWSLNLGEVHLKLIFNFFFQKLNFTEFHWPLAEVVRDACAGSCSRNDNQQETVGRPWTCGTSRSVYRSSSISTEALG